MRSRNFDADFPVQCNRLLEDVWLCDFHLWFSLVLSFGYQTVYSLKVKQVSNSPLFDRTVKGVWMFLTRKFHFKILIHYFQFRNAVSISRCKIHIPAPPICSYFRSYPTCPNQLKKDIIERLFVYIYIYIYCKMVMHKSITNYVNSFEFYPLLN